MVLLPPSVPQAVLDLGFELEPTLTVSIGQSPIHTAVLPFGPQGPMQWMLEFVGRDLSRQSIGSSKPQVELDVPRRQLATRDGVRLNLITCFWRTPLIAITSRSGK
jgi:hypothetical protein